MAEDFQARARTVLPAPVTALLEIAGEVAETADIELLLVGGAVRDILLGRATEDVDLMVVGSAAPLVDHLAGALNAAVEAESHFRTWRLVLPDARHLDLAEARSETYSTPGSLPSVAPGTLEADLSRRDFAINAMAVRLGRKWSAPIDRHGGVRDLTDRRLRALHGSSFDDDPTRILRGLELGQRLSFDFDEMGRGAARRVLAAGGLETLSAARFRTAWERAFGRVIERGVEALIEGLESASRLGLLAALGSELNPGLRTMARRLSQAREAAPGGLGRTESSRLLLRALARDDSAAARRLAMLWTARQEAAKAWADFAGKLSALRGVAKDLQLPSQVATALAAFDTEELILLDLLAEDAIDRLLTTHRERVLTTRLTLSGKELMALGYEAGPAIGAVLVATHRARMDGLIGAEDELQYACERLGTATK